MSPASSRHPSRPGPLGLRRPLAALAATWCVLLFASAARAEVPQWVTDGPGVYKQKDGKWEKADWRDHRAAIDKLLADCCKAFTVPFALPEGTTILPGEDDKDLTRERTRSPGAGQYAEGPNGEKPVEGAQPSHCGLDIGSRVSRDGGKTLDTLGDADVHPVHKGGYMRVKNGELKQRIKCEKDGLRVVLEISYGHVKPAAGIGRDWAETPKGPVGKLDGDDKWTSRDPKLPKKGNHIHLEVEGLYDKTWDSEMAHNQQLDGREIPDEMADLLQRRAAFLNDCLLKQLTRRQP